jgi:hypothetical protein
MLAVDRASTHPEMTVASCRLRTVLPPLPGGLIAKRIAIVVFGLETALGIRFLSNQRSLVSRQG